MQTFRQVLLQLSLAALLASCGDGGGGVVAPPAAGTPTPPTSPPANDPLPAPAPAPVPEPAPAPPPVQLPVDPGPWSMDVARGQVLFEEKCQHCHGPYASGGYGPPLGNPATCAVCAEFTMMWRRIDEYMPFRNPEACDAACSRDIAAWFFNGFSPLPSCSVTYRYDGMRGARHVSTIRIDNFRGVEVPGWRLGFTVPTRGSLVATGQVVAELSGDQILLKPLTGRGAIPSGASVEIGLESDDASLASRPPDLRLEAPPCFTAPATNSAAS